MWKPVEKEKYSQILPLKSESTGLEADIFKDGNIVIRQPSTKATGTLYIVDIEAFCAEMEALRLLAREHFGEGWGK